MATQCGKQLKGLLQRTSSHSLAYVFKELSFTGLYLLKGSENQIRIDKKNLLKLKMSVKSCVECSNRAHGKICS